MPRGTMPFFQANTGRLTGSNFQMIRAIYKIGDPKGGRVLVPLIRDPDKKIHDEAIFALGRLHVKEAVPIMVEMYISGVEEQRKILGGLLPVSRKDDLQRKLLEALAHIGDVRSRQILLDALADSRKTYRRYGAEGLGRLRDPSLVPRIVDEYTREDSSEVRLALNFALFRLGLDEHLPELVRRVNEDQAYFYLLELETSEVPKLHPLLRRHGRERAMQIRLLDMIGQRGDVSSLKVVEPLTRSQDTEIASSANLALRRLRGRNPGGF